MTRAEHVAMPYGELPRPDVVDFLFAQHMQIRDLAAEVIRTSGDARRDAFRTLVHLLSVHETAEEEVVHPVARRLQFTEDVVEERLAEEHRAKELLKELDGTDVDAPEFLPKFLVLREAVISHALYEQRYELSKIRQHLSEPERAAMGALVRAAEAVAPTRPHPGVESAKANLALGPAVAVVDRVRDAIRAARVSGESRSSVD